MKNYVLLLSICFILCSCKEKAKSEVNKDIPVTTATAEHTNKRGTFKAVAPSKTYEVEIDCSYLEEDYFQFKSDKLDVGDSNGDGLNISGFQNGKGLMLAIVDNGVNFSAPNVLTWEKTNNGFKGSATLYEEGSASVNSIKITFTGYCK
ncbi:hypothetical protein BN863_26400 [Formosa agariphila KMM 3901]|uniref:Lipoprotein n=1 Tax=Formosa agariphila (strain DSM 15362 / KCTC 12365 / LMG 23005 / KMM 3901 / M-2Alg 35-1) TaxID=1347342 RepID=T2KNB0_FORAG|nr:hypothetical protein [Formosa agariphila]CDF80352.1 hypothetical protein BN863_26400 [Formosa agariphila KMM 3901]